MYYAIMARKRCIIVIHSQLTRANNVHLIFSYQYLLHLVYRLPHEKTHKNKIVGKILLFYQSCVKLFGTYF